MIDNTPCSLQVFIIEEVLLPVITVTVAQKFFYKKF